MNNRKKTLRIIFMSVKEIIPCETAAEKMAFDAWKKLKEMMKLFPQEFPR